ncbi:MAG: 50S ribosomal protein L6 [Candidatus Doudnabacteria bacterium]|nr:50S ribosomal protein L6 [Candidatus Doudnabacteria bacterium]
MSRIGKKPIVIPSGVKVEKLDSILKVSGPKGNLEITLHPQALVSVSENEVVVDVAEKEAKKQRSLWGLFRSLIFNMVEGVTKGFEKRLEINGVGFKVDMKKSQELRDSYKKKKEEALKQGDVKAIQTSDYALKKLAGFDGGVLEMQLGFSHPVFAQIPSTLNVALEKNVIIINGADKQAVGQFAAEVRELKKPEPYKGKGIKYSDEVIVRKAGKVVKVVGGGK